jgi:hypothetical protein
MDAVQTSLADIAYNVKAYGAKGDGITDDTIAIQNAINAALNNGGDVFFPKGYYRVTQPIKVGQSIFDLSQVVSYGTDYPQNNTVVTANQPLYPIGLIFSSTVGIFADFAPSSLTAVIEYNLLQNNTGEQNSQGRIIGGLSIYGQGFFSNGKPSMTGDVPASNNLIGLFACAGVREIANVKCVGLGYGIVNANAYWQKIIDCYGKNNGTNFYFRQFNAGIATNLVMWNSTNGIVCDGQAMDISHFHTEQVQNDIIINFADTCSFGPAYLEDVSTLDGTGSYSVSLGTTAGVQKLTDCIFRNILVVSVRPNKKSFRLWGLAGASFIGCRNYSIPFDFDSFSGGCFINGDLNFIIRSGNWNILMNGNLNFGSLYSEQTYGISVLQPFEVSIPSTTVSANDVAVVYETINSISTVNAYRFALISKISGLDDKIVLSVATSGTTLTIILKNISTSPITTSGIAAGLIIGLN